MGLTPLFRCGQGTSSPLLVQKTNISGDMTVRLNVFLLVGFSQIKETISITISTSHLELLEKNGSQYGILCEACC